jgi:hypothetical protein
MSTFKRLTQRPSAVKAAARRIAAAKNACPRGAGCAAGGAGNIIFGAVGQNGKLVHQGLFHAEYTSKVGKNGKRVKK